MAEKYLSHPDIWMILWVVILLANAHEMWEMFSAVGRHLFQHLLVAYASFACEMAHVAVHDQLNAWMHEV